MKITKEFTLNRPVAEVWAFFQDIPAVAACLPGAEYLGTKDDGSHAGKMSMKVGPFQAAFEGAANVTYDDTVHTVAMDGKGVDKKGASRGKMKMNCAITGEGDATHVSVDADVQLSGSIAQFGRTGIIEEIAGVLISDFVANVEAALPATGATTSTSAGKTTSPAAATSSATPAKSAPISGFRLIWLSLRSWLRSLFATGT